MIERHLEIYSEWVNWKLDECATDPSARNWKNLIETEGDEFETRFLDIWEPWLEEEFAPFGTFTIEKLIKTLIRHLTVARSGMIEYNLVDLIVQLYFRNWQLEGSSRNEQMLAKELLQEVIDVQPKLEELPRMRREDKPLLYVIMEYFLSLNSIYDKETDFPARPSKGIELMKLLLSCKFDLNYGNAILHEAVGWMSEILDLEGPHMSFDVHAKCHQYTTDCVTVILEKGVYPNASDLLYCFDESCDLLKRTKALMQGYERQHSMKLAYMAAVVVKRSKIPYEDLLPNVLVKFVNLIGQEPKQCWEDSK